MAPKTILALSLAACGPPQSPPVAPRASSPASASPPVVSQPGEEIPAPRAAGSDAFEAEARDEAWASATEEALRRDFALAAHPSMDVSCRRGRCRIRVRMNGDESGLVGRLQLHECRMDGVPGDEGSSTWLLDCYEGDDGWARRSERELRTRFDAWAAEIVAQMSVVSVECRTDRCRIVLRFPDLRASERVNDEGSQIFHGGRLAECGGEISGAEPVPAGQGVVRSVVADCRRGNGGWGMQRSEYESSQEREAAFARLRQEPRDEAWAPGAEAQIRTGMESSLGLSGDVTLGAVECDRGRCQADVRYPTERGHGAQRWLRNGFDVEGCGRAQFVPLDQGAARVVVECALREGESRRAWAARTRSEIERTFAARAGERGSGASVETVECRTTKCVAVVRGGRHEGDLFRRHGVTGCNMHAGMDLSDTNGRAMAYFFACAR